MTWPDLASENLSDAPTEKSLWAIRPAPDGPCDLPTRKYCRTIDLAREL